MSVLLATIDMPQNCKMCILERELPDDAYLDGHVCQLCRDENLGCIFTDIIRNSGRLAECPLGPHSSAKEDAN